MNNIKNAARKDLEAYCDLVQGRLSEVQRAASTRLTGLTVTDNPAFKTQVEELVCTTFAMFVASGDLKSLVLSKEQEFSPATPGKTETDKNPFKDHVAAALQDKKSSALLQSAINEGFIADGDDADIYNIGDV